MCHEEIILFTIDACIHVLLGMCQLVKTRIPGSTSGLGTLGTDAQHGKLAGEGSVYSGSYSEEVTPPDMN